MVLKNMHINEMHQVKVGDHLGVALLGVPVAGYQRVIVKVEKKDFTRNILMCRSIRGHQNVVRIDVNPTVAVLWERIKVS